MEFSWWHNMCQGMALAYAAIGVVSVTFLLEWAREFPRDAKLYRWEACSSAFVASMAGMGEFFSLPTQTPNLFWVGIGPLFLLVYVMYLFNVLRNGLRRQREPTIIFE